MRKHLCSFVVRYNSNCLSLIKCFIYKKKIKGRVVIILGKSLLLILYFLQVHWFYFLGSNNRQQTIDEENPETHQLLSNKDKDRDGVYIFKRNVQDKYYSLKLESISSFCAISF